MTNSELFTDSTQTNSESTGSLTTKYDGWEKEALIKKALSADTHISKLEAESAERKESQKLDETLQAVLQKLEQPQNYVRTEEENQTTLRPNSSESLSKTDVENLVSTYVQQEQKKSQAKANVDRIKAELKRVWGEDYRSKVTIRADDLGVPQSYLESMAETHPDAFLKLIMPTTDTPRANTHVPPTSTQSITDNSFKGETYKEFRTQEKANPALLYDPQFQKRKLLAAQKLGDDFYK